MDTKTGIESKSQSILNKELDSYQPSTINERTDEDEVNVSGSDIEKGLPNTIISQQPTEKNEDSNTVHWDGPGDPGMALNWPARKKWTTILILATLTLLTPFASSMFAPSVSMVMQEFHSDNETIGTLVVSIYLLGYAFGPLFIAPLSEMYGRLPVYHSCMTLFILFNVACAKSTNFPMLIVFRVLTGTAGAGPLTLGPGSIADMYRQEERGKIMAIWTLPILLGPTIGPIAGGYLSESLGWRWDFWFLIIVTGTVFIISILFLRETSPLILLERRAARLRKSTGNISLKSALKSPLSPRQNFRTSIIRPTKMLIFSPIILGLSVLTAVIYGVIYLLFTTMSSVFEENFGIPTENVGLVYLGIGIGQILGVTIFGFVSDRILRRLSKGGEMKPEYRLPPLLFGVGMTGAGLLWYGWSAQYANAWIVPILGQVVIGAGVITCFMPVSAYLVDGFTQYAASANAANTVLRSLGGALLPLAGPKMYAALGLGGGNTLLVGIVLACVPLVLGFIRYGERIRTSERFRLNL
ncbi:related to multidrug resistant protein [Phialocephala subalpina]|uniref:Related to multidrug resistant protein n=1 Tax=Phialocephala subalpina TaxID=576137 RepID=A0A1L7X0P0_9HELO|nr:related to multidrug resistant protein [Phialocephala subalpina]